MKKQKSNRYTMTVGEALKMAERCKYAIVSREGYRFGVNTAVATLKHKREGTPLTEVTKVTGYKSCSLQEYISRKLPFVRKSIHQLRL